MLVSTDKYTECQNSYVSYGLNKSDSTSATAKDIFTATTILPSPGPIQIIHNSHRNIKSPKREADPLPSFTFDLIMSRISLFAPRCKRNMGSSSGPEISKKLRFPNLMTSHEGGKVVSLTRRLHLPLGNPSGTHFC